MSYTKYEEDEVKNSEYDPESDDEEENCIYCREMNDGTISNPLLCDPQPKMINNKWKCAWCCDESEDD